MLLYSVRDWLFYLWRDRRKEVLVVLFFVALFITLIVLSAKGPRIDDHFWYLADVESLINGHGVQSNNIFPVQAIRGKVIQNPPFVHNVPFVYLAAIPGSFIGAYNGWVFLNVLASLFAAFFIYKSVRLYTSSWISISAGLLYLFLPATVWLTSQLLVEAMVAPFVAAIMYLFLSRNQSFSSWVGIVLISVFLVLCKQNFLLLIPIIPVAYSVCNFKQSKWFIRASFLLLTSILLLSVLRPMFPNNPALSRSVPKNQGSTLSVSKYFRILSIGVPGKTSNMDSFYNLHPHEITKPELIENLWLKTKNSLRLQFLNSGSDKQIFYLPFNIMFYLTLLGALYFIKKRKKKWIYLTTASLFFAFLHFCTVVFMQNQFRYLAMTIPALVISTFSCYGEYLNRKVATKKYKFFTITVLATTVLSLFVFDYYVVHKLQYQYDLTRRRMEGIESILKNIPSDENIVVESMKYYTLYAYQLQPRQVLYVRSSYSADELRRLIKNVQADWILCKDDSYIISKIGLLGQPRYRLRGITSDLLMIKLPE